MTNRHNILRLTITFLFWCNWHLYCHGQFCFLPRIYTFFTSNFIISTPLGFIFLYTTTKLIKCNFFLQSGAIRFVYKFPLYKIFNVLPPTSFWGGLNADSLLCTMAQCIFHWLNGDEKWLGKFCWKWWIFCRYKSPTSGNNKLLKGSN